MANACFTCHGEKGDGDTPLGAALNPKPRNFTEGDFKFDADGDGTKGSDADLMKVIESGAQAFGGSALMAPYAALSETDRVNLVAFVRAFKK